MARVTRAVLNTYFETGDIPTQAQMIDLVDSSPNIIDDGVNVGGASGITAFAGGGQANATVLTKLNTSVGVAAAPGDSIKFPPSVAGMTFTMINATANSVNLYPAVGEQIMALGVNNPQAIASAEVWVFGSAGAGWAGGRLT